MRTIVYVDGFNLYYKRIRTSDLAASQLPQTLTDATGTIHKPANW